MEEFKETTRSIDKKSNEQSVNFNDPKERKLARRLRIQNRLEEAARLNAINDGSIAVGPETNKSIFDEATEISNDILENLFIEGKELVSNIRVASDAREVERREIESEDRSKRLKILEEEAASALEKLNEITKHWEIIQDVNDPLNLHQHMRDQKAKCLELIQQKNDLIKNFQMELKLADQKYMKDRQKMYEDLSLLTQRIDEQVLVMKKAYRLELKNIETIVDTTRSKIMEENQKIWQSLYNQREKNELAYTQKKFKMVENHDTELEELHKDHEEKYRETRIRLETDIQTLEQELERVKALCLLNSEKLDYNYQVLKKREEENVYIKNHQKRKLNKLQDTVSALKKKLEDEQRATKTELKRIRQDVERFYANVTEIEKKAEHFALMNEDTYQNIWDMKVQETKELLKKILSINKTIHEQIFGISWREMEINIADKTELPSYKKAIKVISELFFKPADVKINIDLGEHAIADNQKLEYEKGHQTLLKKILEMVADQSGFLIEDKLDDLLKPYSLPEKTLVRLDNVFKAIGISTKEDVDLLEKVFLPYAKCSLCNSRPSDPSLLPDGSFDRTHEDSQHTPSRVAELEEKVSKAVTESSDGSLSTSAKAEEEAGKKQDSLDPVKLLRKEVTSKSNIPRCNITHPLIIEKVHVLNGLKDFVKEFRKEFCRAPTGMAERLSKQRNTISRLLAKDEVEKYWQSFKEVIPDDTEKTWDVLFQGLTRYHEMLQDRHKLNLKAQKLRKQNAELRRLLTRYIPNGPVDRQYFLPQMPEEERKTIDIEHLHEIMKKIQV